MQETDKSTDTVEGTIIEALPNMSFMVELDDGRNVLSYLSGRMRMNRIRVLVGDKVSVVLDDYGERGRITRRN